MYSHSRENGNTHAALYALEWGERVPRPIIQSNLHYTDARPIYIQFFTRFLEQANPPSQDETQICHYLQAN